MLIMMSNLRLLQSIKAASLAVGLLVFTMAFASQAQAQDGIEDFRRGEVLVEIRPGASIDIINERYGTSTIQRIYGTNFYRVATPKKKKEAKFRKRLAADSDVLNATLNPVITTPVNVFGRAVIGFPGDRPTIGLGRAGYLAQQLVGDLNAIRLRASGAGLIIAVIDTGIDRNHPDIKSHIWTDPQEVPADSIDNDNDGLVDDVYGWNFLEGTQDTMELRGSPLTSVAGHGTFIAGLIALIAPNAKIMPVRAFSPDGVSDAFSIAQGIKYAVDHGARIINLSFGSTEDSPVMHDAVAYAQQRGVLLIAAVGNENKGNDVAPQFPANWNVEVMGIAAIDANDHKAGFSNYGSDVSVSAPGVNLVSIFPENNNAPDYASWSGTSFAAPLAAAEAALILESSSRSNARAVIEATAASIDDRNPGFAGKLGKGRIDPLRALQSLDPITANHGDVTLLPTAVEPAAAGKAEVSVSGGQQEFEIEAEQLQPRAAYKIVVDGNVIVDGTNGADPNRARAITSNFGAIKIEFSTPASGDHVLLPAALNPVTGIKKVEIADAQGRIVLSNTFGATPPGSTGGQSVEKEATLAGTSFLPQAHGRARAEVEPEREKLRIEGEGLVSGVAYHLFTDTFDLGTAVAQSGFLRVEFTSDGSSGVTLPSSARPVTKIAHVELRDPSGQVVLQGTFQAGGDDFGGGGSGGGGDDGGGGGGQDVAREAQLNSTGVDNDAKGKVKTEMSSSRQTLEIEGEKLDPNAQYDVVVDGFSLGHVTTDGGGSFKIDLSTENGSLPAQVRPVSNIQRVNVIDSMGRIVLTGGPPA